MLMRSKKHPQAIVFSEDCYLILENGSMNVSFHINHDLIDIAPQAVFSFNQDSEKISKIQCPFWNNIIVTIIEGFEA